MRFRLKSFALLIALFAGGYALAQPNPGKARINPPAPESPLLTEPKTPVEMFEAAVLTDDLSRPALTKSYLEKLLQSNPSDDVLMELRNRFGPAVFLRLAREPQLQPAATQLLERVTAIFRKRGEDPAFIDSMIRGLQGPPAERDTSFMTLKNAGPAVVPRILQHIASPVRAGEANLLVNTLVELGEPVVPVLLGALESTDLAVRNAAIQALGLLHAKRAVPYLLEPAFNSDEPAGIRDAARRALARILGIPTDTGDGVSGVGAAAELKGLARQSLEGRTTWPAADGLTDLWTWNSAINTVVLTRVAPMAASLYTGLQFARQAVALAPADRDAQTLFLALFFAWDAQSVTDPMSIRTGPGTPHDVAVTAGPAAVSDTLALGLKLGNPSVALGALGAMSDVGGAGSELYTSRAAHPPLVAALNDPNPDVQYMAAATIVGMNVDRRFSGASRVVEIFARALVGSQAPVAIIIDPNHARANETGGVFSQVGFESLAAYTGRSGFDMAAERSNTALVAIHVNSIRWPLSQTIANLRADARTARVPIIIYGPESVRSDLQRTLSQNPPIAYLIEGAGPQEVQLQLGAFLKSAQASIGTPASQVRRLGDAVARLASIANSNRTVIFPLAAAEDALIGVSTDPVLSSNALAAMAAIPTSKVQRQFEQLAVSERLDPSIREGAARQLAAHIHRYGLLLSAAEAAEVQAAWRSAASPEVATSLAAVMGSLKPNPLRVGTLLLRVPAPLKPAP
jgi:HEAT repeat protein